MNNKDRVITILAIIILVSTSIGIFIYELPFKSDQVKLEIDDFFDISSEFSILPGCVEVTDSNPFYTLIATPLAVNYNENEEIHVVPLYVQNFDNPSKAITRAYDMIGINRDLRIINPASVKSLSLEIAESFWEKSDGVIIIQNSQEGYNLGALATPLASYLSIPVIVVDTLDSDVKKTLGRLGVEKSIICGDIEGYGNVLKFDSPEDVTNATIEVVRQKFGKINYITITNPIDIYTPKVLDSVVTSIGPVKRLSKSTMQMNDMTKAVKYNKDPIGEFTIPTDYKYALIKFKGINYGVEDVDTFGDGAGFSYFGGGIDAGVDGSTAKSPSFYDSEGNTIRDEYYTEQVLYDMGGTSYPVTAGASLVLQKETEVEVEVVVEKLSDPLYPMMKNLSSVAPYLTAYRKGIIFGKPGFAFTADDDVQTENGESCAGPYMGRANTQLQVPSNNHIYNNIHLPINKLLAKLADIPIDDLDKQSFNLKKLQEFYTDNPVYITLVGGVTVLPQFVYDSVVWGSGLATDFVYGNIDPITGWDNVQNDMCSKYPFQENIVGRITGYDVQDASALITRTIFYNEIISKLGDWKNKATVQLPCGTDFAKPFLPYIISQLLGSTDHVSEGYSEPLRWSTGQGQFVSLAIEKRSLEPMGYTVSTPIYLESGPQGLSDEAIYRLKTANLKNLLFLPVRQLKKYIGEDKVVGGKEQESSNFIFINGHGEPAGYHTGNEALAALGSGYIFLPIINQFLARVTKQLGRPGQSLTGAVGAYNVRNVDKMNFGPSFMWLETCLVGWIDGRYPKTCISQAYLHSGMNALLISPTTANVAGGYLEPYRPYSSIFGTVRAYIEAKLDAKNGVYPDLHFGEKICEDTLTYLKENDDATLGEAFRDAKNRYLPEDADWQMYWTPPLGSSGIIGSSQPKDNFIENKYVSFQEYCIYGDPAFKPYVPLHAE